MRRQKWDVFISHASEDKDAFVRPFVCCLVGLGLSVWYDELVIYPGDSLRRSIDEGLVRCNYVVTVLSQAFFKKKWTQHELAGIFSRETRDQKIVIPVWFGVGQAQVAKFAPILADRIAITSTDPSAVAREVYRTIRREPAQLPPSDISLSLISTVQFVVSDESARGALTHSISGPIQALLPATFEFMIPRLERRLPAPGLASLIARELLVNAIAHRDYSVTDFVSVRMGTSSVTVSSPGLLPPPLTVRALKSRHTAIARNPGLAHDLYRLGYMELFGSGLDQLQRRLLERSWPLLSFRETKGQFAVEVALSSPQEKS